MVTSSLAAVAVGSVAVAALTLWVTTNILGVVTMHGAGALQSHSRGRAKEILPPNARSQGSCHENKSFVILFYIV